MALTPVQKELGKISADYRRFRILRQLSLCWAGILLLVLVFLGAQHFFNFTVPYALPLAAVLALACVVTVFGRNPRKSESLAQVARQIESDNPKLNSLLLAALEQNPDPRTGALNFLQQRVILEALEENRKSPWHQKFLERLFFARCAQFLLLIALGVSCLGLGFYFPKTLFASLDSNGVQITPGDVTLEKGSALAIIAKFREAPAEVNLLLSAASQGQKKIAMSRSLSDPMFGASFTDLKEDATYRVEYGGRLSPEYHIHIFEYPELKRADAELKYPDYTGFKPAKIEGTRRVTAVEGTRVNYTFYVNKPLRSALLRGPGDAVLRLTNEVEQPTIFAARFPLVQSQKYQLELIDEEGRTNKFPAEFDFVALKNEPPKLKLLSPRGDPRVSALEEVRFQAEAEDDFGLARYGLAYSRGGAKTEFLDLSSSASNGVRMVSKPHEARAFSSLLPLEKLRVEPGEMVSYYLWAEDLGPDGKPRRTEGDMYFAEVRPFEEIFRENNSSSSSSQQQQQQQNNPSEKLLELQKQIITASWNIQRRENPGKLSPQFKSDAAVVKQSQDEAIAKAGELKQNTTDEKTRPLLNSAVEAMSSASKKLASASKAGLLPPLQEALNSEQAAYQALLKLQAREYQVSRSRSRSGQQSAGQQRAQRELDQLELKKEENRYETESQASPLKSPRQEESIQVLSRLKELAQRQQDMSGRLKELQTALNEAKTEPEREKIRRELKRLEEEQQQIVQDMDELRQRMSRPENQSQMANARQNLDKTREQSREAAEQLQKGNVGQALSSSTRAQQQLQNLSDEFRKSTSSQFAEQMRQMREEARALDEGQEQIAKKMDETKSSRQRSLSDEGPKKEILEALARQKSALTNLLQNMRQVTEQSETAEPLLSRQLYENLRRSSQSNPEKALDLAAQLTEKNFLPQAAQAQNYARENIHDLRQGIERAANDVLGDEAESLRFAQRELETLTERVKREMSGALSRNATNDAAALAASNGGGTNRYSSQRNGAGELQSSNRLASVSGNNSTNNSALTPGTTNEAANNQRLAASDQNGAADAGGRSQASGEEAGRGNSGEESESKNQAQNSEKGGQQGGGQPGQLAANGSRGAQAGNRQASNQQGGRGSGGSNTSAAENNSRGSGRFFDQWANRDGAQDTGGGDGEDGPLMGSDYSRWSDRLRDIEEILQNPALRTDAARVRERARDMRLEFKRHATLPQWSVVQSDIVKPLYILQTRVEEALAHIESREAVAPVDRDPVPAQYSELVNRYYENLGKN
jgi:hypothetical protein